MANVSVTNRNDEPYARRFDGKLYEFAPGEAVVIPTEAARYIFGYGGTDADRSRILVRNGWQKNGIPDDDCGPNAALKRLQNFVFKAAADDPLPAKPKKKIAPSQERELAAKEPERKPGGIGAMSALVDEHGNRTDGKKRETIHLPGSKAALAPRLPPA